MIYVNVDSPNLGFPYFNFLGGAQCKKHPVYKRTRSTLHRPSWSNTIGFWCCCNNTCRNPPSGVFVFDLDKICHHQPQFHKVAAIYHKKVWSSLQLVAAKRSLLWWSDKEMGPTQPFQLSGICHANSLASGQPINWPKDWRLKLKSDNVCPRY